MKSFENFVNSINVNEMKSDTEIALADFPLSDKQKETLGALSFGIALDLLSKYHEWIQSDND